MKILYTLIVALVSTCFPASGYANSPQVQSCFALSDHSVSSAACRVDETAWVPDSTAGGPPAPAAFVHPVCTSRCTVFSSPAHPVEWVQECIGYTMPGVLVGTVR